MKESIMDRNKLVAVVVVWTCCLLDASVSRGAGSPEAEYKGADAVLSMARESKRREDEPAKKRSPAAQLRADLKSYAERAGQLAPADAAAQWLELLDRCRKLEASPTPFRGRDPGLAPVKVREVVEVLPPPGTWAELDKAIAARSAAQPAEVLPNLGLKILAHTLNGHANQRQNDIAELQALARKARNNQVYFYNNLLQELSQVMLENLGNADLTLQVLERELAAAQSEHSFGPGVRIPDLVPLVGAAKAESLLRKAIVSGAKLSLDGGTQTTRLAQKLALELAHQMKKPQWSLVNSLDAVDLYEALDKRFAKAEAKAEEPAAPMLGIPIPVPMDQPEDYERQQARMYYFLGLIAAGRTTNALAVAKQFQDEVHFPREAIRELGRAGFARELNTFFHDLLQDNPELPFWDQYVESAAHAGATAEMVQLMRSTAGREGLSRSQKLRLEHLLYKALLANDEVEPAVAEIKRLLEQKSETSAHRRNYNIEDMGSMALRLAQIGRLLNRTDWMEEGVAAAKRSLTRNEENQGWKAWKQPDLALAEFLRKANRGVEAEAVLAAALTRAAGAEKGQPGRYGAGHSGAVPLLAGLVKLYHHAGRHADVLTLFEKAPYWGVGDLAQIKDRDMFEDSYDPRTGTTQVVAPVGYYAAAALAKTGRANDARKILDQLLQVAPGCDRLYELLLELEGDQAGTKLDAFFASDQFEERPLIWKAHWLRTHGQLEEAEKAARKAISVDPTDGEEPPGDRLRAYAELAEIRAARGDEKEARTLRSAVSAVHEAEDADQFQEAGLLKRAVAMYEHSLNTFADAYCIHARLAVQLSDLGRHQAAEEHYRRAYELMPEQFGRVESHCFGCERAFDGERAQRIAERVFIKLVETNPDKPQVHYMLGYLREEEERYKEAVESFRNAVKLDPDYLNAWRKLESLGPRVYLSPEERDQTVFNILRLDPFHRHGGVSLDNVMDLAGLWGGIAAANAKRPPAVTNLFPLLASKAEIERQKRDQPTREFELYHENMLSDYLDESRAITPGKAVADNVFVRAATRLLGSEAEELAD